MWILWSWRKLEVLIIWLHLSTLKIVIWITWEILQNSESELLWDLEKYQPTHKIASTGQAHTEKGSIKTTAYVWFYIISVIKTRV